MHARVSGFFLCPNTEAYGDTLHDKHSGASDTCDSGKKNKKKTAVPGALHGPNGEAVFWE